MAKTFILKFSSFFSLLLLGVRCNNNETGNSNNTQQSTIPPTIDEESSAVPTGNGDAIHHAPMLQVKILHRFNYLI